jgi:hypothetical protein
MASRTTNPGSQADKIQALLAKNIAADTVRSKVKKAFPKKKSTLGYINWLAKNSISRKSESPSSRLADAVRLWPLGENRVPCSTSPRILSVVPLPLSSRCSTSPHVHR